MSRFKFSPKYGVPFAVYIVSLQVLAWLADPEIGQLQNTWLPGMLSNILIVSAYVLMFWFCAYRGAFLRRPWLMALPVVAVLVAYVFFPTHPLASAIFTISAVIVSLVPPRTVIVSLVPPRKPERQMYSITRKAERLASKLLSDREIKEARTEASKLARAADPDHSTTTDDPTHARTPAGPRRGDAWDESWAALNLRAIAEQQLRLLGRCTSNTKECNELHKEDPKLSIEELVGHYKPGLTVDPPKELSSLTEVTEALNKRSNCWKDVLSDIHRIRTRVFAVQSLYRLALRSQIEIASLIVGFLVAAGALQVAFRHQAAAGTNVAAYWTLDDFFVQAILIALPAALVLILVELLFRNLRKLVEEGKPLHDKLQWTRLNPNYLAVSIVLFVLASSTYWGYLGGISAYEDFKRLTDDTEESATVTDGTILHDVFLVDTTSRTAVFLQKQENLSWHQLRLKAPQTHSYTEILLCVIAAFVPLTINSSCSPSQTDPYRVIVMDRAHVVCHATGNTCETLPRRLLRSANVAAD